MFPESAPLFLKNFKAIPGVKPTFSGLAANDSLASPKLAPLKSPS